MSAVIETFIRCDRCGQTFGEDKKVRTSTVQRAEAKKHGWGVSEGKDICPDCRVRTKPSKINLDIS